MLLSVRELLVKQRTQLVNAMRGHATEFGVVVGKGLSNADALVERARDDASVPEPAKAMIAVLGERVQRRCCCRLPIWTTSYWPQHKAHPVSRMFAEVPGIGPLGALTLALTIDATQFHSARHFAAWLGLTPKENSTGGKPRLGGISREGNERLRQLLVLGATSVIRSPPNLAAGWRLGGCCNCWRASRAGSRRSRSPTRWPASCGP